MEYVNLGRTGIKVSRICLGCMTYGSRKWREWCVEEDEAREHFVHALEAGINFFDTANVYSVGRSEEITGRYLRELGGRRDELVIATKVGNIMARGPNLRGLSRKHIIQNCEASLRRLRTDYIDLYQVHRLDFATPIEETLEALDALVKAGKVRYLGASSMAAWQFAKALFSADLSGISRFVAMQNYYNLVYREEEREMIPLCLDQGVALIPWSPLARGFLSGNRDRGGQRLTQRANTDRVADTLFVEEDFDVADAVRTVAQRRGLAMAQVALAWLLRAPGVAAPIIGSTRVSHLDEAIGALTVTLSSAEVAELEAPYRVHRITGHAQPEARRMVKAD